MLLLWEVKKVRQMLEFSMFLSKDCSLCFMDIHWHKAQICQKKPTESNKSRETFDRLADILTDIFTPRKRFRLRL